MNRWQKLFSATRCVTYHRFSGDGGATGLDLTQLAGRFNLNDLTEATMVPSKVISDQYKGSTIVTMDLLKTLNQDEVLDLLAYLLSRGDAGHEMFWK